MITSTMNPSEPTTRRSFLGTAAGASAMAFTARSYGRIAGANERISIGVIGCGGRGRKAHMEGVHKHDAAQNVEITAVCDPWRVQREEAAAMAKEWYGKEAQQFARSRDLLEKAKVDAIMIASPDHHHAAQLEASVKLGKHVYVEKPMVRTMTELLSAVDAVKEAGVVVQVGTQTRSSPKVAGLRELFKSGILGKPSRIEQMRNSEKPYWHSWLKEVRKEDVDWEEFLFNAPKRPFDPGLYSGWYGYREFSDGPVPQLGAHFIDLMHFVTGATYPVSCVCLGDTFTWIDEHKFTTPDHVEALWIYPEGFMVSYSTDFGNGQGNRIRFGCQKGTVEMTSLSSDILYSAKGGPKRDGGIRGDHTVEPIEVPDHFLDWLQCMRNGKTPVAPIEAGYQHCVACIMGVMAMDSGKRMIYDHAKREIREG